MQHKNPSALFKVWYDEAVASMGFSAKVMCLATVGEGNIPSARVVTLKEFNSEGFKFFTDYKSRKAEDMDFNENVAATFFWHESNRSVRIEGKVEKLDETENEKYFTSIPKKIQLVLGASRQSAPIPSVQMLYEKKQLLEQEYEKAGDINSMPHDWGGYIIHPVEIEFYQGQKDGFHHRLVFRKLGFDETADGEILHEGDDDWVYERLAP